MKLIRLIALLLCILTTFTTLNGHLLKKLGLMALLGISHHHKHHHHQHHHLQEPVPVSVPIHLFEPPQLPPPQIQ